MPKGPLKQAKCEYCGGVEPNHSRRCHLYGTMMGFTVPQPISGMRFKSAETAFKPTIDREVDIGGLSKEIAKLVNDHILERLKVLFPPYGDIPEGHQLEIEMPLHSPEEIGSAVGTFLTWRITKV